MFKEFEIVVTVKLVHLINARNLGDAIEQSRVDYVLPSGYVPHSYELVSINGVDCTEEQKKKFPAVY